MKRSRAPEDPEVLRRRGIHEEAKSFEEEVAHLFSFLGYQTTVDYVRDAQQFDIRMQLHVGVIPVHVLVECKNLSSRVTQKQVREFASKVEYAIKKDELPYQAILVARSGFAGNAHEVAKTLKVHLQTYEQLLRSLVDLRPNLDAAIRTFQGTALETLYVEQDVVFDRDIKPGQKVERKGLTDEVRLWLKEPSRNFLALLGDFGCGKTSFSRRLACELALEARRELAKGEGTTRVPVLIDLRDKGSTTVTLENLLTHHFQCLSSQPFNPQALLHLNREGYLVLIFDGFDETIAYTEHGRYLDNLRQILRAAEGSKSKVLMTCRTHYFRDRPDVLNQLGNTPSIVSTQGATDLYEEIQNRPGSEVGYLLEFREEQIQVYLQKALPPSTDWRAFREQIRETYNLENLAERPFLLEIIVKTLPRLQDRKGKVTLADLYEGYCETWFSHNDFRLTLTRDRKVALVEYLARLIWDSPENRVHYETLYERATGFFEDRRLSVYDKERIDYEVRTALFLRRDDAGNYSFIHRSFLEFFVARTLRDGLAQGNVDCLGLKRITREVAFFLELWPQAQRIPEIAGRILDAPYQAGVSENALLLLYFHARAQLGPLVGPQSAVEPDLLEIQKTFSGVAPKSFHLDGADLEGAILPGIDLSGARLEGAKLGRADLRQASLDGAKLAKADLGSVDFRHGRAEGADLAEASLDHLDGRHANFRKATLRNTDLSFARLSRADLQNADVAGIQATGTALLGSLGTEQLALPATAGASIPNALDLRWQTGHLSGVSSVAWSPDGRCVATGSNDGSVKIWDAGSGQVVRSFSGHGNTVNSVAWSLDGTRIASGSDDNSVKVWEAASGRLLNTLAGHDKNVLTVAWSADGTRIASGSADHTVKVWDSATGRVLNTLSGHDNYVLTVAWSADGTRIASGSWDKMVKIWDAASGRALNTLTGHENWVRSVAWSPDGTRIASGSFDKAVKVWFSSTGRLLNTLPHDNYVLAVAWSADGTRIASGSYDKTVKVWDASAGRVLNTLVGHDNRVNSVAWSPDGTRIASGSYDETAKVWDAATGRVLNTLRGHDNSTFSVMWSPDGTRIASGSEDQTVKIWDITTDRLCITLKGHDNRVNSVAWSPDGTRIASGSEDNTVKVWDAASGRALNTLPHDSLVLSVCWSADGTRIASGSADHTVKVWDSATGRVLNTLSGHDNYVLTVAWSADGTRIASGSNDRTVKVWDAATGRVLNTLTGHNDWVRSVSWSADGTRIASGSNDRTVKVWDAATGRVLNTLPHDNYVLTVAWSADGTRLASGSLDKTVKVWDAATGRALNTLAGHDNYVFSVAWSPDGTRLVAASSVFLHVWDLTTGEPRLLARFFSAPGGSAGVATPDGYVFGPSEALDWVRFGDGWALYDVTDVPERVSEERVLAALRPKERWYRPGTWVTLSPVTWVTVSHLRDDWAPEEELDALGRDDTYGGESPFCRGF